MNCLKSAEDSAIVEIIRNGKKNLSAPHILSNKNIKKISIKNYNNLSIGFQTMPFNNFAHFIKYSKPIP